MTEGRPVEHLTARREDKQGEMRPVCVQALSIVNLSSIPPQLLISRHVLSVLASSRKHQSGQQQARENRKTLTRPPADNNDQRPGRKMADKISELLTKIQPVAEPLLVHLRPLTHSLLPAPLVQLGRDYYTARVFDAIVLDLAVFDPKNSSLLQLFVSKTLSIGIIGFSSIVKLPQILNIVSQSSARGLSFVSILLETLSYLITIAYNFRQRIDFINFGEVTFVALQNVVILVLVLYYSNKAGYINAFIGVLAVLCYSFLGSPGKESIGVLADSDIKFLAPFAVPLTVIAKLPQILGNFQKRSTGALSLASVGAGLLGTLVRAFTIISGGISDSNVITGLIASLTLNLVLFLQILAFKPRASSTKKNK